MQSIDMCFLTLICCTAWPVCFFIAKYSNVLRKHDRFQIALYNTQICVSQQTDVSKGLKWQRKKLHKLSLSKSEGNTHTHTHKIENVTCAVRDFTWMTVINIRQAVIVICFSFILWFSQSSLPLATLIKIICAHQQTHSYSETQENERN